jgi:hypothetical protein
MQKAINIKESFMGVGLSAVHCKNIQKELSTVQK